MAGFEAMNAPSSQEEKQALYDAWWIAEVNKGLADLDTGRVLSDADMQADMALFLATLAKEFKTSAVA